MQTINSDILIHEVGLRDGLQIEQKHVPLETKIDWAMRLLDAKVPVLQLGSFVHPAKVPQMADTDMLFKEIIERRQADHNTLLSGLVLNEKGMERGLACGAECLCMGVSASNTHSIKNTGMTTDDAINRIIAMARIAKESGVHVQVSIQSAFGCGYEGLVDKSVVMDLVRQYLDAGLTHISLADTTGYAYPGQVIDYFSSIYELENDIQCTCHFHDTYGAGIANCLAAYQVGVRQFETSFGGLGGCPFTRIHSGNVCSEDLIYLAGRLTPSGLPDLNTYIDLSREVGKFLGHELSGRIQRVGIPDFLTGDQS